MTDPRRFPPPWSVDEQEVCFIVRDDGQALAYVYFEDTSRDRNRPTMAREAEEEWNKARPRRSLFDVDQKALVLRSPTAR